MLGISEVLVIALVLLIVITTTRQAARRTNARGRPPAGTDPRTIIDPDAAAQPTRFLRDSLTGKVPRALLVVIRLVQGQMWLSAGWHWLTNDTIDAMTQQIRSVIAAGQPYPSFVPFLEGTVLPWIGLFAVLVTVGELFVGLSLTFGAATRLGAAVGMFLSLSYACLYGDPWLPLGGNWLSFFYLLPVLVGAAGRSFGADYWLHPRYPSLPIW